MKTRTILASLVVFLAGVGLCLAADPNMGTWKLNEAKSKYSPGATKNNTVVYAPAGDMVKVTVDGTDKDGKPTHNEWTGKFDGQYYPVTGDPNSDSRAYTRAGKDTISLSAKKGDKVVVTGKIVISPDGKSRTVSANGTDASGGAVNVTAVYDKQ